MLFFYSFEQKSIGNRIVSIKYKLHGQNTGLSVSIQKLLQTKCELQKKIPPFTISQLCQAPKPIRDFIYSLNYYLQTKFVFFQKTVYLLLLKFQKPIRYSNDLVKVSNNQCTDYSH